MTTAQPLLPLGDAGALPAGPPLGDPPGALALLRAEAARSSKAEAARRIGYSRSAVSMRLSGTYPGETAEMDRAIVERLGTVQCPHLRAEILGTACRGFAERQMPLSDAASLRHWSACKSCPLNPTSKPARNGKASGGRR